MRTGNIRRRDIYTAGYRSQVLSIGWSLMSGYTGDGRQPDYFYVGWGVSAVG